ncbi:LacI family transcriptional regulator [Rathayibacter festucae]|uniref:LacI family DNA-binding transcriptional regulator n=1 Tax=Rathayibacter festucae TaxID=110937 RepID=UPI001FB3CD16|nr:LacI family DNA-binding transcriptional regulator [Rathayibacter festucae]MCJ1701811.1 LacI family transcriptional regulator [Rathayibacter festucae]
MESTEPTLKDVATASGVSVATASRALAGRGDLSRATRERVADAADSLGYLRKERGRGRPRTLDPHLIELVLGSFDDAWTTAVTSGARDAAFRLNFDLVLTLERENPAEDWPTRVATRRPSGVIVGIIRPTARQLAELQGLRIPVLLLDPRSDPEGELPSIGTTDRQGGYDAGVHLASTGVDRFVIVSGVPQYRFGRAREEGFRAALAEHRPGARVEHLNSDWSNATVTEELMRAFASHRQPVGVFACNDEMALVVYEVARRLGRRIPEDISVVGFNDEPRASLVSPPLTSVRQPLRAMAARAVERLRELRERNEQHHERIELPTELIVRGSTLAPALEGPASPGAR